MGNFYLKGQTWNHLLKMEQDRDKLIQYLLEHHPNWEQDISYHFTENVRWIRESMIKVLNRNLDKTENERLRQHSMDLALIQVADMYRDEIDNVETKEKDEQS